MQWVKAALTLLQLIQTVVLLANERRLKEEGAAEAIEKAAKDALNEINKAHEARMRARDRDRTGSLHDDADEFRRD
jgi:hypothetical protein